MTTPAVKTSPEVLNSWKEIAAYLNRGVRTVQRWEARLGLPIRRPAGKGRSAVIAIRCEIDAWLKSCPLEAREEHLAPEDALQDGQTVRRATLDLVDESHQLRREVARGREELRNAINQLATNLMRIVATVRPSTDGALLLPYPSAAKNETTAA